MLEAEKADFEYLENLYNYLDNLCNYFCAILCFVNFLKIRVGWGGGGGGLGVGVAVLLIMSWLQLCVQCAVRQTRQLAIPKSSGANSCGLTTATNTQTNKQ